MADAFERKLEGIERELIGLADNVSLLRKILAQESRDAEGIVERALLTLEPFAKEAGEWADRVADDVIAGDYDHITVGDLRAARDFYYELRRLIGADAPTDLAAMAQAAVEGRASDG